MAAVKNDGFGRMQMFTRFSGSYLTEWREEGYYWSHLNSDKWAGPFKTRDDAKAAELASISKKRKRKAA